MSKKPLHEVVLARLVGAAELCLISGGDNDEREVVVVEHLHVLFGGKMKAEDARNVASELRKLCEKLVAEDRTSFSDLIMHTVLDLESRVDEPEDNSVLALYTHDE